MAGADPLGEVVLEVRSILCSTWGLLSLGNQVSDLADIGSCMKVLEMQET